MYFTKRHSPPRASDQRQRTSNTNPARRAAAAFSTPLPRRSACCTKSASRNGRHPRLRTLKYGQDNPAEVLTNSPAAVTPSTSTSTTTAPSGTGTSWWPHNFVDCRIPLLSQRVGYQVSSPATLRPRAGTSLASSTPTRGSSENLDSASHDRSARIPRLHPRRRLPQDVSLSRRISSNSNPPTTSRTKVSLIRILEK